MTDHTEFLHEKARQLRELAANAPEVAAELRRLADELDAQAAEDGHRRRRPRPPRQPAAGQ